MRRIIMTALLTVAVAAVAAVELSSVSAAPTSSLAGRLAAARLATAKYATNLDRAKADGYQVITPMIQNMGHHYMNLHVTGFDIRKPPILVYLHHGTTWQLGALEWVFPKRPATAPVPGAKYGFFPAACHYTDGTFVPAASRDECAATSPTSNAKFNFWHGPLVTLHIWLWYPNPAGLYSGTNPLVTPFNKG